MTVIGVEAIGSIPVEEMMGLAAAVQRGLQHPIAAAIVQYTRSLGVAIQPCQDWRSHHSHGLGVGGKVGDRQVRVGSRNYLESEGVVFPDSMVETLAAYDGEDRGLWHFYVAADGEALGRISCCDGVRGESERVIAGLHQRGLEVCLVTSNCAEVAQAIAAQVNIPAAAVHAETSPEAKVDLIHAFQAVGKTVVYLGEGLDDYAALCAADVAIGTNRSCHLIREMADLLLPADDLTSLLRVMDLADQAIAIIHQNIALIAIPNVSIMLLGILFALDPLLAVILNSSANLLAELNGFRPLATPIPEASGVLA